MSQLLHLKNLNSFGEKTYLINYGTTVKLPWQVYPKLVEGHVLC